MEYRRLIVVTAAMILGGITLVIVRSPEHAVAASVATPPQQAVTFIDAVHDLSPPLRDLVPASTVAPAPAAAALDMIQTLNHTGLNVVQSFDGIVTPGGSMGTWPSDANADALAPGATDFFADEAFAEPPPNSLPKVLTSPRSNVPLPSTSPAMSIDTPG